MRNISAVLVLLASIGCTRQVPKIGCVDTTQLIAQYGESQPELQQIRVKWQKAERELDSIQNQITWLDQQGLGSDSLRAFYMRRREVYQKHLKGEDERISRQVTDVIDQLIAQYAKKNNYSMIVGANQSGNVLFVDSVTNITEEILKELHAEKE